MEPAVSGARVHQDVAERATTARPAPWPLGGAGFQEAGVRGAPPGVRGSGERAAGSCGAGAQAAAAAAGGVRRAAPPHRVHFSTPPAVHLPPGDASNLRACAYAHARAQCTRAFVCQLHARTLTRAVCSGALPLVEEGDNLLSRPQSRTNLLGLPQPPPEISH